MVSVSAASRSKKKARTRDNNSNNISISYTYDASDYYCGVRRRVVPVIFGGWVVLTLVYVSILALFRDSYTVFGLHPAAEYCPNGTNQCNRTDLFAFQVASGITLTVCAAIGFYTWHGSRRVHAALPNTPEGRLFGYLPESEIIAALNFAFQSWDFCVSLTIPEHATRIMLSHHVMAATVTWCAVHYQYLHYYAVFFAGLTEVSSIFLVFLDLSNYYPTLPGGSWYETVVTACGPLFVFAFVYYRIVLWWPESYRLLQDVRSVVKSGHAQKLRPNATWVLFLFLAINLPLGLLQLYWVTIIADEVKKSIHPALPL